MTPSRQIERVYPLEPSGPSLTHSRNESSALRNRSPASGRVTPGQMDKLVNQSMHRPSGCIKEPMDRIAEFMSVHKQTQRKASNPRLVANNNYYMYRQPSSTKMQKRRESNKDLLVETTRVSRIKQPWGSSESLDMSASGLLSKKPAGGSMSKREKKKSLIIDQGEEKPSINKSKDSSQLKLKDHCMFKNLNEFQLDMSLGRELNKMELAQRKQNLFKKLSYNEVQKLNNSQFQISFNQYFEEAQKQFEEAERRKEYQRQMEALEQPIGTEEFYQDFFNMDKMTFNFEKSRVSQRAKSQRDYFIPETTVAQYSSNPTISHSSSKVKTRRKGSGHSGARDKYFG